MHPEQQHKVLAEVHEVPQRQGRDAAFQCECKHALTHGMQQKLQTTASTSVQACTGAEMQQHARECTDLMSVQACTCINSAHAAPTAVNAREHSRAAWNDLRGCEQQACAHIPTQI
jgi:hypothetical protein